MMHQWVLHLATVKAINTNGGGIFDAAAIILYGDFSQKILVRNLFIYRNLKNSDDSCLFFSALN